MRLIDAERLKADVFKASMDEHFMPMKLLDCDTVTEMIDTAPTIEERKTGKWIPAIPLPMEADSYKHKRYWKCSVCGKHDFFNPQYSEKIKFCRWCGTELEVEE